MRTFRAFWTDVRGTTAMEYAIIAGFISIAVVVGVTKIGTRLNAHYIGPVSNGLS